MVENAFGILASRFRVLLTTMEQRPKVVRDIVLTSLVLHNMLRSHQGGEQRDHQLQQMTYNHHRMTRGSRDKMKMSEIHRGGQNVKEIYSKTILTTLGHWLGRRTEFKKTEGEEAVTIKQSVLLRTTQELLMKKCCQN